MAHVFDQNHLLNLIKLRYSIILPHYFPVKLLLVVDISGMLILIANLMISVVITYFDKINATNDSILYVFARPVNVCR